jgi:beta-galactosidase
MLRRDFIKATGTVIAVSALPSRAVFASGQGGQTRTVLPINRKWRYHPSKVEGAHLTTFNDAAFESVIIPHTNVSLPWHSFDDKKYEQRRGSVCSSTLKA